MNKLMKQGTRSVVRAMLGITLLALPLSSMAYAAENDQNQQQEIERHYDRQDWDDHDQQNWHHSRHIRMINFASHHMEIYRQWLENNQIDASIDDPVAVVQSVAYVLGFDADNDAFSLLNQDESPAIVQVIHNGNTYHVTVEHRWQGGWRVTAMEPIQ